MIPMCLAAVTLWMSLNLPVYVQNVYIENKVTLVEGR